MGRSRFVAPESVTLPISGGDYLEVQKRLTAGQDRRRTMSVIKEVRQGGHTPDLDMLQGKAGVMAYLIDWSLKDAQGKKVEIDTDAKKAAALDNLTPEDYDEIREAIEAHERAMEAERSEQGKTKGGEPGSSAISPSPESLAGATTGS